MQNLICDLFLKVLNLIFLKVIICQLSQEKMKSRSPVCDTGADSQAQWIDENGFDLKVLRP